MKFSKTVGKDAVRMIKPNEKYRDRLFRFMFGSEKNKEWTLSLYNAINGSNYTNVDDITINTIDDIVYMGMKNDVSFLVGEANMMNFYEQQSTYNPNMPIRFLIYAGMVYSKYVESKALNLYSSKVQKLPIPKCVCFYNGRDKKNGLMGKKGRKDDKDEICLELNKAFGEGAQDKADIDVRVRMINVNYGYNEELVKSCEPLNEYSFFVKLILELKEKGSELRDAINMAIDMLDDNFVIKPFLRANREEVNRMVLTEYDEEKTLRAIRKEEREEGEKIGLEKGKKRGLEEGMLRLYRDGDISKERAAEVLGVTVSEFEKMSEQRDFSNK